MRKASMRYVMLLCVLVVFAGCGDGSGMVPVKGKILLDGAPLPGASVSFVPQGQGKQATGTTDDQGVFTLSTIDPRDGAMPGKYKVILSQNLPVEPTPEGLSADEAMQAAAKAAASKPKSKSGVPLLPDDYTRIDKTPLMQEVPVKDTIVYDIKSK